MYDKEFIIRTSKIWDTTIDNTISLLQTNYLKSVRINTINQKKSTLSNIKKIIPPNSIEFIDWSKDCYKLKNNTTLDTHNALFSSGQCIIQNASSYISVLELKLTKNDKILDLCAAPGSKSSHIAMLTNNKSILVLNDTSKARFFKMRELMNIYNVKAEYSLRDGRNISKYYPANYFNKILVDAPCSGEANITISDTWKYSTIKRLQKVQITLLNEAYKMLASGGRLVYSTCTIAPEENELVVNNLLDQYPQAQILPVGQYPIPKMQGLEYWKNKKMNKSLKQTLRLLPGEYTKPFYIAVITKNTSVSEDNSYLKLSQGLY